MPKPRYPYLHKEVTRHGRVVWYFRRGSGARVRIDGAYGSPDFNAAYEAALAGASVDRSPSPAAPRVKPLAKPSYVYFIQNGDTVKIGVSCSPPRRRADLQIGSPVPLRVIKKMRGGAALERELHRKFDALKIRGEWFSYRGALAEFIRTGVCPEAPVLAEEIIL